MVMSAQQIVKRQDEILEALARIRVMERGTLCWQRYPERAKRRGGKGAVGPYGLWQGTVGGKRFGRRIAGAEAERVNEAIAQRHAFESLCEEYTELGCRLAALGREGATLEQALKKGLKSQSNRARKSDG